MKAHDSVIKVLEKMQQNYVDNEAKTEVVLAIGNEIRQIESKHQELLGAMENLVAKVTALEAYLQELRE